MGVANSLGARQVPREDHLDSIENVGRIARRVRWGIWLLATACVVLFAWLQIDKKQVIDLVNTAKPDLFLKILVIIYYFCWVGGASIDLNLQQSAMVRDPFEGKLPKEAYALFAAFAVCSLGLLWASSNDQRFAIALGVFWIVGTAGGFYLRYVLRKMMQESASYLRMVGDYYRLERLLIFARYQVGHWQIVRNWTALAVVVLIHISAFVPMTRESIANGLALAVPGLQAAAINALLTDIFILVFILVTEVWVYLKRAETLISLRVLDDLKQRYSLELKQ
jgi:hypothetical protein